MKERLRRGLADHGIFVQRGPQRGLDAARDIARACGANRVGCIFDVGANVGETALHFAARFPDAAIWCFEPVPSTFHALSERVAGYRDRITPVQIALGAREGVAEMAVSVSHETNRVTDGARESGGARIEVPIRRLDAFVAGIGLAEIDFLKIDTEGHDLAVIEGAETLLQERRIRFVQVEAAAHAGNRDHVAFPVFATRFSAFGYDLFGIYDQMPEADDGCRRLRRMDMVFARPDD